MYFTAFGMVYIPGFKLHHHLFHKRKRATPLNELVRKSHSFSVCISSLVHCSKSRGEWDGVSYTSYYLNYFSDIEKPEQNMLVYNS